MSDVARYVPFAHPSAVRRLARFLGVPGWRRMGLRDLVAAVAEAVR
jgi:hypothetical protein